MNEQVNREEEGVNLIEKLNWQRKYLRVIRDKDNDGKGIISGWIYCEESIEGSLSSWRKRWFSLCSQFFSIFLHVFKEESMKRIALSMMEEVLIGVDLERNREFAFTIIANDQKYYFATQSEEQREKILKEIRRRREEEELNQQILL